MFGFMKGHEEKNRKENVEKEQKRSTTSLTAAKHALVREAPIRASDDSLSVASSEASTESATAPQRGVSQKGKISLVKPSKAPPKPPKKGMLKDKSSFRGNIDDTIPVEENILANKILSGMTSESPANVKTIISFDRAQGSGSKPTPIKKTNQSTGVTRTASKPASAEPPSSKPTPVLIRPPSPAEKSCDVDLQLPSVAAPLCPKSRDLLLHRQATGVFGFKLRKGVILEKARESDGAERRRNVIFVEPGPKNTSTGLLPGDRLIEVNKSNVENQSRETVIEIIKSCGDSVRLRVQTIPELSELSLRSAAEWGDVATETAAGNSGTLKTSGSLCYQNKQENVILDFDPVISALIDRTNQFLVRSAGHDLEEADVKRPLWSLNEEAIAVGASEEDFFDRDKDSYVSTQKLAAGFSGVRENTSISEERFIRPETCLEETEYSRIVHASTRTVLICNTTQSIVQREMIVNEVQDCTVESHDFAPQVEDDAKNELIQSLTCEVSTLKDKIREMDEVVSELKREKKSHQEIYKKLLNDFNCASSKLSAKESTILHLKQTLRNKDEEIADNKRVENRLTYELDRSEKSIYEMQQRFDKFQEQYHVFETCCKKLGQDLTQSHSEINQKDLSIMTLNSVLTEQQTRIETLNNDICRLVAENGMKSLIFDENLKLFDEQKKRMEQLNSELLCLKADTESKMIQLEDSQQINRNVNVEIEQLRGENKMLDDKVKSVNESCDHLKRQIETLQGENHELLKDKEKNESSIRMEAAATPVQSGGEEESRIFLMAEDATSSVDLIVQGFPFWVEESYIRKYFEKFGELVMFHLKRDENQKPKGYIFIRYSDYSSQTKVLSMQHNINGRKCDVRIYKSKTGVPKPPVEGNPVLHILRRTEEMTSTVLRSFFERFGNIEGVFVPTDNTLPYAFVTFKDPKDAKKLWNSNQLILNRSVYVTCADPKTVTPSRT